MSPASLGRAAASSGSAAGVERYSETARPEARFWSQNAGNVSPCETSGFAMRSQVLEIVRREIGQFRGIVSFQGLDRGFVSPRSQLLCVVIRRDKFNQGAWPEK
jgi:hypothetical protein